MPDGVSVSDGGSLASLEERLEKLVAACLDLRPFWPMVIPLYVRWMGQQFDTGGEFFGEQWAELTPDYAAWKSEHYPTRGILMAGGDLRHAAQNPTRLALPNSLTLTIEPFVKARDPGKGRNIDPAWFQDGTERMVARPLMPIHDELPESAQQEVAGAAEVYIQDTARRLGLL